MMSGVFLLMLTGLCWAFAGGLLSYSARNRVALATLLGPQQVLALLVAFLVVPDYPRLVGGISPGMWAMVGVMLAAGLVNGAGLLAMQRAMRMGHHGMTWAIGQSAMVLPFLMGVLLFDEPPTLGRAVGVGAVVASLIVLGLARERAEDAPASSAPRAWFPTALGALVLLGVGQALTSLPSHLPALADPARLRMPLLCLGTGTVFLALWWRQGGRPGRGVLLLAVVGAAVGIGSTLALFSGLDRMAGQRMASLGFPIAVGACIVTFALYSAFWLREAFTHRHVAGLILGLMGMVLLAGGA